MLDARAHSLVAEPAAPLPVEAMVLGKAREDVAELLPRLFNLCRSAQSMAARLALGLPGKDDAESLRREIIRDHVLRLTVILPGHFGMSPASLPYGWQDGTADLAQALFGPVGRLPTTYDDFAGFLGGETNLSALLRNIDTLFGPDVACAAPLPFVTHATAGDASALVENSCAARVAEHPVLQTIENRQGRGPLWRVTARAYDLQALLDGAPLLARSPIPGVAHVPATRGLYTVRAQTEDGTVTAFSRVTPTDHLQAKGGVLDQTLSSLAATQAGLAPLIIDILDPCSPIRIKEVSHA